MNITKFDRNTIDFALKKIINDIYIAREDYVLKENFNIMQKILTFASQ